MKRHHQPLEIASDMNVTNLIDTSFILLITFMLVAPQLKHGIQLELPEVVAPPMDQKSQKVWEISITRRRNEEEGEWIYLNGKRKTEEELYEEISEEIARSSDLSVVIEGDKEIMWEMGLRVIATVQRAGVDNIGLVSKPELPTVDQKKGREGRRPQGMTTPSGQ